MSNESCFLEETEPSRTGTDLAERWKSIQQESLQPQFYTDPTMFGESLRDDVELCRNLASDKNAIRVLAPYLKMMRQKITTAAISPRPEILRSARVVYDKKDKDFTSLAPNVSQNKNLIESLLETTDVLKSLIRANSIVSYIVDPKKDEICKISPNSDESTLPLVWKIREGTTIAAYAAFVKAHVVSCNVTSDERFPLGVGHLGSDAMYAFCVPIKTPGNSTQQVLAVYEITRDAYDIPFDTRDVQTVIAVTRWMGVAFLQNTLYANLFRKRELTHYLTQLTCHSHANNTSFEETMSNLLVFARETIAAETCSLFTVSKSADNYVILDEHIQGYEDSRTLFKRRTQTRVTDCDTMLGKVVFNKETVRLSTGGDNTEIDPRTSSVLCVPIVSSKEVIGVIQLKNKTESMKFNKTDAEMLQVFASFCAISLNHLNLQKKLTKCQLRDKVTKEMLFHHIKPCAHDEEEIKRYSHNVPQDFFSFTWFPSPDETPKLVELTISMFHETLGDSFMALSNVPRFVLTVKNCYRLNPYHNFLHAFCVTHAMANILTRYHRIFTGLERRGLMVAALCHDVDHRGYNNNFVQLTQHHLSKLYESSALENHHFAVTKMLIEQCGMFKYFKPDIYNELMTEIYDNIIATDLALYFQCRIELMKVADEKSFTFHKHEHRRLVKNLMMTASDLSGQTKPLAVCQKITGDVYEEFYQQGDVEKKMGLNPLCTMDREKSNMVPENQVQFLNVVVIPCVETVSRIFGTLSPMVWDTKVLLRQWEEIAKEKETRNWTCDQSDTVLDSPK